MKNLRNKPKCGIETEYLNKKYVCDRKPYKDHGCCIFHSPRVKEKHSDFKDEFLKYIQKCNSNDLIKEYDLRGCFFPEVDLSSLTFKKDAFFNKCQFLGRLTFNKSKFFGKSFFGHSIFQEELYFLEVSTYETCSFSSCEFNKKAAFNSSEFHSDAYFANAIFKEHFSIGGSDFYEHVSFSDSQFHDLTQMSSIKFRDTVYFNKCQFSGDTNLSHCTFLDDVSFQFCIFSLRVNFKKSVFQGEISLNNSRITKLKYINANGLNFDGAILKEISFWHVEKLKDVSFRNAFILSVTFANMKLDNCDFTGAVFDSVRTKGWRPDSKTIKNSKYIYSDYIINEKDEYNPLDDSRVPVEGCFGEADCIDFTIADYLREKYKWSSSLSLPKIIQTPIIEYIRFFEDFSRFIDGIELKITTQKEGEKIRVEFFTDSEKDKAEVKISFENYLKNLCLTREEIEGIYNYIDFKSAKSLEDQDVKLLVYRLQEKLINYQRDLSYVLNIIGDSTDTEGNKVLQYAQSIRQSQLLASPIDYPVPFNYVSDLENNMENKKSFDIGIIIVINKERKAVLNAFGINNIKDRIRSEGSIFWNGKIKSAISDSDLNVVVHCISKPGNQEATNATSKMIERFKPKAIFLVGIAAGIRDKIKIGDVVIPRAVVDDTLKVAESSELLSRPKSSPLPHTISQMINAFDLDVDDWHQKFNGIHSNEIIVPEGLENEYSVHVANLPSVHEVAIYSSDILIKDPNLLIDAKNQLHQQIKIGEMEAAGFISACEGRGAQIPWLIVRGISDFGDELKNDDFHTLASCSAASYLFHFISSGFDIQLIDSGYSKKNLIEEVDEDILLKRLEKLLLEYKGLISGFKYKFKERDDGRVRNDGPNAYIETLFILINICLHQNQEYKLKTNEFANFILKNFPAYLTNVFEHFHLMLKTIDSYSNKVKKDDLLFDLKRLISNQEKFVYLFFASSTGFEDFKQLILKYSICEGAYVTKRELQNSNDLGYETAVNIIQSSNLKLDVF